MLAFVLFIAASRATWAGKVPVSPIIVGNDTSWVGDMWVPEWKLYNTRQIVSAMQGECIGWMEPG